MPKDEIKIILTLIILMVIKKAIIIMAPKIMVIKNTGNQTNPIIKHMTMDMIMGMIIIIIVIVNTIKNGKIVINIIINIRKETIIMTTKK